MSGPTTMPPKLSWVGDTLRMTYDEGENEADPSYRPKELSPAELAEIKEAWRRYHEFIAKGPPPLSAAAS